MEKQNHSENPEPDFTPEPEENDEAETGFGSWLPTICGALLYFIINVVLFGGTMNWWQTALTFSAGYGIGELIRRALYL